MFLYISTTPAAGTCCNWLHFCPLEKALVLQRHGAKVWQRERTKPDYSSSCPSSNVLQKSYHCILWLCLNMSLMFHVAWFKKPLDFSDFTCYCPGAFSLPEEELHAAVVRCFSSSGEASGTEHVKSSCHLGYTLR